jgi:nucleoside-diphosphate-sugar epimerase
MNTSPDLRLANCPPRILVTGASGRIGRHLLAELQAQHYRIRAVTSRELTLEHAGGSVVEWVRHDFMQSLDVDALVAGCAAVLHLAGEVWNTPKMQRVNVEATQALTQAANRAGVKFFGFTSSIAVYGSSRNAVVTEESPVLTPDRDLKSEYRGNRSIRCYGRTKVQAEREIVKHGSRMECLIFRPSVVTGLPGVVALAQRSALMHFVLGRRHEHLIYVEDVVHALLWFLERSLRREAVNPGVEIYNLTDDEAPFVTGDQILAHAYELTGNPMFRRKRSAPLWVYYLFDMLKNRTVSHRQPLGAMLFPSHALFATGYAHRIGLVEAQRRTFAPLRVAASLPNEEAAIPAQ